MQLSLRPSHRLVQHQSQVIRLSQVQRTVISQRVHSLLLQLVGALRMERYTPMGRCPNCSKRLTSLEILRGFSRDVNDFTTACPKCGMRFLPSLIAISGYAAVELPYYCPMQVLPMLEGKSRIGPDDLARLHPAEYRSAIVHWGTIRNALAQLGISYTFEEVPGWEQKVLPFLGKLPDAVIARCVNVSAAVISRMRTKRRIRAFKRSRVLTQRRPR